LSLSQTFVTKLSTQAASAFTVTRPARNRGAVQVAFAIECNSLVRLTSVGATGEAVEHRVHPAIRCGTELKNCAASKIATEDGRAINVARAVRLQIRVGIFAFTPLKAKDDVRGCGCSRR